MCAEYDEIQQFSNKKPDGGGLGQRDLMTCRRVLFELYNRWPQSVPFREAKDLNFAEYREVIKEPIALDTIKERLSPDNPERYATVEHFVRDVRKMFHNCKKFNASTSDFFQQAKDLEEVLDDCLQVWAPELAYDETVSEASSQRKKRCVLQCAVTALASMAYNS